MKYNTAQVMPLVMHLGKLLKDGVDHYSDLRAAGKEAGPDIIAFFIGEKMKSWDPKIGNVHLLDQETKAAAARFLAGVACNVATA